MIKNEHIKILSGHLGQSSEPGDYEDLKENTSQES